MSSVSPYSSYPAGDSHNINNGMRVADSSGDTLGLQEKAPSRGIRYLVNVTNKFRFHVATSTSSPTRTNTLWNKDAQRKEGTARTHRSTAHVSALGLALLVYSVWDSKWECGGQSPGNRRRSSEHDHMHAWFIRSKIFIDNEKAMLIPTKASRDIRCGQQQIRRLYVRNLKILASKGQLVSVSAFENIASSMNFLYSEKVSLSKWSDVRVLRIEKISIASLKEVVALTQFSRHLHGG